MNPQPLLPSDPMPGEVLKENNGENGEINNPYYNPGFENLANDDQEQKITHSSDDAIGKEFDPGWDNGIQPDLNKIRQSVDAKNISGAAASEVTDSKVIAKTAEANRNSIGNDHDDNGPKTDQPYELAKAVTIDAISKDAVAEDALEKINNGNLDALDNMGDIKQQLVEAKTLTDKIPQAVAGNADNPREAEMATNIKTQADQMINKRLDEITQKEAEISSMSAEEKEETTEAAEAAKANGTSVEVEKQRIEEEKKDEAEKEAANDAQADIGVTIDRNMLS